ncbi:hypothetical protein CLF_109643 [Clonorchis sinensis]|uniref:Uncharacterized protein n=1 Tax=Clonorchis sinensis TaxID=79923 RepID=G7YJM1_CLOSI|nr:hypothetical protein CLF_109643 [Clonorchis sinensis]
MCHAPRYLSLFALLHAKLIVQEQFVRLNIFVRFESVGSRQQHAAQEDSLIRKPVREFEYCLSVKGNDIFGYADEIFCKLCLLGWCWNVCELIMKRGEQINGHLYPSYQTSDIRLSNNQDECTGIGFPSHELARFLAGILKPLTGKSSNHIKNSYDFANKAVGVIVEPDDILSVFVGIASSMFRRVRAMYTEKVDRTAARIEVKNNTWSSGYQASLIRRHLRTLLTHQNAQVEFTESHAMSTHKPKKVKFSVDKKCCLDDPNDWVCYEVQLSDDRHHTSYSAVSKRRIDRQLKQSERWLSGERVRTSPARQPTEQQLPVTFRFSQVATACRQLFLRRQQSQRFNRNHPFYRCKKKSWQFVGTSGKPPRVIDGSVGELVSASTIAFVLTSK